ncbi:unnamed protein product [Adineta ricciae]|uniref:mRNA-decapping enzyme 2 n=1 Tax=Adineta ricciae TaxID=249248 RepID=A0A815IQE9_ADIRI|nr:unnamed protein product [Adineta ricciae]
MSSDQHQIPPGVLDDLCSRHIINIPAEQRTNVILVMFAVEYAHWFYIDYYCEDDDDLHICNIRDFSRQIFQHCPFLRDYVHDLDEHLVKWREYKLSVPTYGAVLIDPSYEHVLLVQGFHHRESWGFPKGKVQENESPFKCAIREVLEEVGFDIKDRASEDQYLEREHNGQLVRLYMVKQVPLDTKFAPKTKNEIKEMRWFPIADLPNHRRDTASQMKLNINPKAFFMVIPFIKDIRRWVNQEHSMSTSSNGDSDNANDKNHYHHYHQQHYQQYQQQSSRRRTATYHGQTYSINLQQNLFGVDPQAPPFIRDGTSTREQRKSSSKIIANLTTPSSDEQSKFSSNNYQKQLSVQDTIQRHFSQMLKNDFITVTDNTTITETLLMRGKNSNNVHALNASQLTPPMSNDENKHPASVKHQPGKKSAPSSSTRPTQYRILPRGQPDEPTPSIKKLQPTNTSEKSQRNRRTIDSRLATSHISEPLANLTNDTFCFSGPRCWTQFRLNRSEVYRCLQE